MALDEVTVSQGEDVRPRILIVDDQPEVSAGLARWLQGKGYLPREASSGEIAVSMLRDQSFEVVISDVRMPDMSGMQLLSKIRESDREVSVLLMSGLPDLETAQEAIELGISGYISKPVDLERLVALVQVATESTLRRREEKLVVEDARSGKHKIQKFSRGPDSWTGVTLGGRYRIGELIGSGGMGAVYEAIQKDGETRAVAVKILHSHLAYDPALLARFRREAEAISKLDHQNIVKVLDFQAPDDEPAYLVMERLEGRSLADEISRDGLLAVGRVIFIAEQVLYALEAAHAHHLIHRDLKPENIFLTSVEGLDDVVRVLDFGVAKFADQDPMDRLTKTGAVLGTPAYMSPEQARGEVIDGRSDIYALGCVMYEALSGVIPLTGTNYNALLVAIQETTPSPLEKVREDLPSELLTVISRCLAKNPVERFASAAEMRAALAPLSPAQRSATLPPDAKSIASLRRSHPAQFMTTRQEGKRKRPPEE